jgi:hypothetical protein
VFEFKVAHHVCNIVNLLLFERERTACGDVAKSATAGADIATDKKCGSAVAPTFSAVRTKGVLADGMAAFIVYHADNLDGFFAERHFYSQPFRFAFISYFH